MHYICTSCAKEYPIDTHSYRCGCGGLFHLAYEKKVLDFSSLSSTTNDRSLWRYAPSLPILSTASIERTTMGEGGTPLIHLGNTVWGKADYFMPTLSFKDRGAVVLVAAMEAMNIKRCVIDSSGNAATAVAAYCARVGISCEVFVPAHTSSKKIQQISAHGATVHKVTGTREDTAKAAIEFVESTGAFYASHIYNPLFWEGTKTYLYELYEQLDAVLPEVLIVPVGNGTLLMGVVIALEELRAWNLIDRYPLLIAVQAANCAPLATAFGRGLVDVEPIETHPSLAEGIASARPARGSEILEAVRRLGGRFVTVTEQQILDSRDLLARRGIYVEITSAANHAGYLQAVAEDHGIAQRHAVIPLCGAGLKSSH